MRIGILSDTHNQRGRTRCALDLLKCHGAESLIHCGDFVNASMLELLAGWPSVFVFGNNDSESIPELRSVAQTIGAECLEWGGALTVDGKRLAITHGHLNSERRRLAGERPDYLISGHSHRPADHRRDATRWINPGALHRSQHFTVALLDVTTDELRFLEVPARADGAALRKSLP